MKKQSYIYYMFWVLLLIQIILTIMASLSQGIILPLAIFPGMSLFFLFCLRYLLHYNLNQSPSEPLFVLHKREINILIAISTVISHLETTGFHLDIIALTMTFNNRT